MENAQRKEFIRQVFNTVSEKYGQGALRFFANAASQLPALLDLRGDERLLDIATGTGLASTLLASHLPEGQVTGIDLSEGMLKKAQALAGDMGLENIDFRQMDMTCMDLPDNHFDVINASFGVFFVEDMDQLVKHVHSKLKPGGRFITSHFAEGSMAPMQQLIMNRLQLYGVDVPQAAWMQLDSEASNRALYERAGFQSVQHFRKQAGYHFKDASDWWEVVWWAGFRGFVNQIAEDQQEQFRIEHLEEVNQLAGEDGIFFNIDVIYTIGE